jgi:SAM-dependent methyltransferase
MPDLAAISRWLKRSAKVLLPAHTRRWLRVRQARYGSTPVFGTVRFGSFRRLSPIHRGFGVGRGTYVDRYYIDKFIAAHSADVRGHVLEVGVEVYTRKYGGDRVIRSEILDIRPDLAGVTIVADLASADHLPSASFDCILVAQTLQYVYEVRDAIRTLHRILRPSGVVLATVPGIAQIAPEESKYCGDYWRFTSFSAERLFAEHFPPDGVAVRSFGNVLAATAFLHGLAAEELRPGELDHVDPEYQFLVCVRAEKAAVPVASAS